MFVHYPVDHIFRCFNNRIVPGHSRFATAIRELQEQMPIPAKRSERSDAVVYYVSTCRHFVGFASEFGKIALIQ